jgi:hypothetical protein
MLWKHASLLNAPRQSTRQKVQVRQVHSVVIEFKKPPPETRTEWILVTRDGNQIMALVGSSYRLHDNVYVKEQEAGHGRGGKETVVRSV